MCLRKPYCIPLANEILLIVTILPMCIISHAHMHSHLLTDPRLLFETDSTVTHSFTASALQFSKSVTDQYKPLHMKTASVMGMENIKDTQ